MCFNKTRPGQRDSQVDANLAFNLNVFRLATHLRGLAWNCDHFGWAQINSQVDASFSPFGHPTQVDTSWSLVICICVKCTTFCDFLRADVRIHLATHRKSVTCIDLRVCLARALRQLGKQWRFGFTQVQFKYKEKELFYLCKDTTSQTMNISSSRERPVDLVLKILVLIPRS